MPSAPRVSRSSRSLLASRCLGAVGWSVLAAVARYAQEAGLLVIADGKRGDIDVSAGAYAQALSGGADTPFGAVKGWASTWSRSTR